MFEDFPEFKVTDETKRNIILNPQNYSSCDVRIRMGRFYTDDEYLKYIEDGLNRELPGTGKKLVKRKNKKI